MSPSESAAFLASWHIRTYSNSHVQINRTSKFYTWRVLAVGIFTYKHLLFPFFLLPPLPAPCDHFLLPSNTFTKCLGIPRQVSLSLYLFLFVERKKKNDQQTESWGLQAITIIMLTDFPFAPRILSPSLPPCSWLTASLSTCWQKNQQQTSCGGFQVRKIPHISDRDSWWTGKTRRWEEK